MQFKTKLKVKKQTFQLGIVDERAVPPPSEWLEGGLSGKTAGEGLV